MQGNASKDNRPVIGARQALLLLALALVVGACQSVECAEGLESVDGVCRDDCGGCPTGQLCDNSTTPDQCRCPAGYQGDPCRFSPEGLIKNPDFDINTGERFWFDEGPKGANILPLRPFSNTGKLGVGLLIPDVICNAGSLTQVVTMPSFELTREPLVAEVTYQAQNVHGLAIGFDRAWTRLRPTSAEPGSGTGGTGGSFPHDCDEPVNDCEIAVETFCLGEAAYGGSLAEGEVTVRISASERRKDCTDGSAPQGRITVKRFWIRPATGTECVDPATGNRFGFGDVLNGTADPRGGGWRFETDPGIEGALDPSAGSNGLGGARLFRNDGVTGRGSMTTKMSVPLPATLPSPALRFQWQGSLGQRFAVHMGTWLGLGDPGRQVDTLVGMNATLPAIYCLPPWTHGNVVDVSFSLADDTSAEAVELTVDDVQIVSDPDCGNATELLDPSFDADNRWFGASVSSLFEQVRTETNGAPPGDVQGNRFLELVYGPNQAELSMETYVLVPPGDQEAGPAMFFHAAAPTPSVARIQWFRGLDGELGAEFQPTPAWGRFTACLPATWSGRWYRVQIAVGPDAWLGSVTQDRLLLDDFSVGTSADCDGQ